MARSQPMKSQAPAPRLYLVTPQVEGVAAFERNLAAALEAVDVAAVLLRLGQADERSRINCVKAMAPIVQDKGVALLLDGDAGIVAHGGADGAHLTGIDSFLSAVETLKPGRIAGCAGLTTRHDAMTAAERGADYVMFGDADNGRRPSFETVLERVAWWAEVFQVPCVALAASLDEVAPLAAAGADFVAVGDFIWNDSRGAAAALAVSAKGLTAPESVV
jgi:thiamine-phosphate pyrophosphorylase